MSIQKCQSCFPSENIVSCRPTGGLYPRPRPPFPYPWEKPDYTMEDLKKQIEMIRKQAEKRKKALEEFKKDPSFKNWLNAMSIPLFVPINRDKDGSDKVKDIAEILKPRIVWDL